MEIGLKRSKITAFNWLVINWGEGKNIGRNYVKKIQKIYFEGLRIQDSSVNYIPSKEKI